MSEGSRGAKGIDGNKGADFLTTKQPYEATATRHDIWARLEGQDGDSGAVLDSGVFNDANWRSHGLPRGGPPRYAPKGDAGTKSPSAASPTGKYAKKGGSGQRSGS